MCVLLVFFRWASFSFDRTHASPLINSFIAACAESSKWMYGTLCCAQVYINHTFQVNEYIRIQMIGPMLVSVSVRPTLIRSRMQCFFALIIVMPKHERTLFYGKCLKTQKNRTETRWDCYIWVLLLIAFHVRFRTEAWRKAWLPVSLCYNSSNNNNNNNDDDSGERNIKKYIFMNELQSTCNGSYVIEREREHSN